MYLHTDATTDEFWNYWQQYFKLNLDTEIEWVVTNPPFKDCHLILEQAWQNCSVGCIFLLRSTFSEPCKKRRQWLINHSDNLRFRYDINPRPKFKQNSNSDFATLTWFVWLKNWSWRSQNIECPFQYIIDWNK